MPDNVQSDKLQAMCEDRRKQIMHLAKHLAEQGAHYLWGAEGQTPSSQHPYYFASVTVSRDPAAFRSTTFGAASLNVNGEPFVCAGRCFAVSTPAAAIIANAATDKRLREFIDAYHKSPFSPYTYPGRLTPRLIRGTGDGEPMDYTKSTPQTKASHGHLDQTLVWGEACNGKPHFDCGGFVRWVVRQVCAVSIAGISANPTQKNQVGQPMGRKLGPNDTVMKADILVYNGHVALATGDPALPYRTTTRYTVAQADCATNGVNFGQQHDQDNTSCIRLSDSTLIGSVFQDAIRASLDGALRLSGA